MSRPSRSAGRTIRGRIVRMLALPVVAMLLLLTVVVLEELTNYRLAARTDRAITLDLATQDLVQEMQTERGVTAGLQAGNDAFRAEIVPARQRVDEQRAALDRVVAAGGGLEAQVTDALERTGELTELRGRVDAGGADRDEVFAGYTELIEELGEVYFALDNAADEQMRRGSEALTMLNAVKETTARQRAFLNGVFSAGGFRDGEFLDFVELRADRDINIKEFEEYATPAAIAAKNYLFATGPARQAQEFETIALGSGDGRQLLADPQAWWSSLTPVLDDLAQLGRHIGTSLKARAQELLGQANRRMAGLAAVVLLCMAGSIYLGTVAARSLARPLTTLADDANRLAGEQLPEAVRRAVGGDDTGPPAPVRVGEQASAEVRLVADAFERVQATAYALATEQAQLRRTSAESLANLGRRNQNLLRRQLGFITKLESEETTPAGLANLFELDHLATRMRRNAESLLVLVGAASPRQWPGPLPMTDVIRAAVSEVEEYRRVSLRRIDETLVAGSVVSGLAHMLAELIENGLAFSPPDLDVELHGRLIGDGYLIAVCDQGVGMTETELDRANQRLRGEGDFLTAPARILGHYVVGRLAADMGIQVQLARSAVTGVTARVALPVALLAAPAAVPARAPAAMPARQPAIETPAPRAPRPRATHPRAVEVDYVVLPSPSPSAGPDVTPNGLRKRIPRARRPQSEPVARPAPSAPVTDSPEAVRTRLTALRDGIQRGTRSFEELS